MKILYLTMYDGLNDIEAHDINSDLLRVFAEHKHKVYIVSPVEKRTQQKTHLRKLHNCRVLKVRTGNLFDVGVIEKGISQVLLNKQFKAAIKRYYGKIHFDLVLYTTPPIMLADTVRYVKKRDHARTYLLLKDIFPQNAVDIGMLDKTGIKGILYHYFRRKEKELYRLSDNIGCMSQANVDYVLKHNPEVEKNKVEICPNCVNPMDMSVDNDTRISKRRKYGIPVDKIVFVYGGNLGKPQGIPFLIKCLKSQKNNKAAFFLIVGSGTEYGVLEDYIKKDKPDNVMLMSRLPKEDYDAMVGSCDVGLIFLDHRFTIPNFPSRLLSYMQAKMPVLAVTDPNTDIGKVIVDGGFGWRCESNNVRAFGKSVREAASANLKDMGEKSCRYLENNYTSKRAYEIITCAINGERK